VPWALGLAVELRRRRAFGQRGESAPRSRPPRGRRPQPSTIVRATRAGAMLAPLRSTCLLRASVAVRLLHHYGYPAEVVVGVPIGDRLDRDWRAHAWVDVDPPNAPVEGYAELARLHR
jgi:hypothetical protein